MHPPQQIIQDGHPVKKDINFDWESCMSKIGFFCIFAFFSMAASADYNIEDTVQLVSQLLTDQNAVFVENSVSVIESDEVDVIFATFSIEGYQGGNNFQQFIVAFMPEFKTEDSPPFQNLGDPKYRVIGIRHLCPSPTEHYRRNSLEINNGEVTGICEGYNSQTEFSVEVNPYDIAIKYR